MSNIRDITAGRRMAFGPKDKLMSMANIKYPWAVDIHERMLANFWTEKVVAMGDDRLYYRSGKLHPKKKRAYDKALAFVSNLDGIQFHNLVENIGQYVTAPEVSGALARQAAEEYLHVRAYQTMIEAVALDPSAIYMMFQSDGMLAKKNAAIMAESDLLKHDPNPASFFRALVANVRLEGLNFYSAFYVFYALARDGEMIKSADMIKYINRDEGETHLDLFTNMFHTHKAEYPELYDAQFILDARRIIQNGAEQEMAWGRYIIDGGYPGVTNELMDNHIMWRANVCSEMLGLGLIYPGLVYASQWFIPFSQPGGRVSLFEGRATDYQAGGLEW